MSYSKRLEKMMLDGTITPDQAKNLEETLAQTVPFSAPKTHKKLPSNFIALIGGILTLLFVMTFLFTGGNSTQEVEKIQNVAETMNQASATGGISGGTSSSLSWFILFLPLAVVPVIWMPFIYNRFVTLETQALASWAHVESCYQKRADLLPNLIVFVQDYMQVEKDIQSEASQSYGGREDLGIALQSLEKEQESADRKILTPSEQISLQEQTGLAVTKLLAVIENYPDLKAFENVLLLQRQLENIEEKINAARLYFNESVRDYNKAINKVPGSLIASMGRFRPQVYFKATLESTPSL